MLISPGFLWLKIKWLRQFKVSPGRISCFTLKTGFTSCLYIQKLPLNVFFFSFIVTTAALMASSVLRFLPIEQPLYQPSNRRFPKMIPQTHRGTSVAFQSMSRGTTAGFHDLMTSPVGSRPLSFGPGQCWCWFPRIHRDKFHPPETEMKKIMPLLHWDTNRTQWFDSGD